MFFLLGLLGSTALFGSISLVVFSLFVRDDFRNLLEIAISPSGFAGIFISYMVWSLPAFVAIIVVHIFFVKISNKIRGFDTKTNVFMLIGAAFTNPFRGLTALIGARKVINSTGLERVGSWGEVIIHFIWSVALFCWLISGFLFFHFN